MLAPQSNQRKRQYKHVYKLEQVTAVPHTTFFMLTRHKFDQDDGNTIYGYLNSMRTQHQLLLKLEQVMRTPQQMLSKHEQVNGDLAPNVA